MSRFHLLMLGTFATTLFTSATLLFLVQPMIGKLILPLLGGTPAVWNTCMVFFQALLLGGYAYAHASTTYFGPRKQALVHMGVMFLPFIFLPISINSSYIDIGSSNPIPGLLTLLFASVGVPFFVVSSSAPILQKWFSSTDHPAAKDPYFLYGASNLGSMLALVGYPALVEPNMMLLTQRTWWTVGYGLLLLLCGASAWLMYQVGTAMEEKLQLQENSSEKKTKRKHREEQEPIPISHYVEDTPVSWTRRGWWILMGAIPSSLMLGATTYMTTDIAAIPLLWVLPLGVYLLTFIIVFLPWIPKIVHTTMVLALPMIVLLLVFMMLSEIRPPKIMWTIGIHLFCLFVVAMVCHGALAQDRPSTKYLTEYFLYMSLGGVVGGLFNGLLAPVVFYGIIEYSFVMMIACLILPPLFTAQPNKWNNWADLSLSLLFLVGGTVLIYLRMKDGDINFGVLKESKNWVWHALILFATLGYGFWYIFKKPEQMLERALDIVLPLTLAFLSLALIWGLFSDTLWARIKGLSQFIGMRPHNVLSILTYGVPTILCYTFVERSLRFGLSVGALLLAAGFTSLFDSSVKFQDRSFFGVLKVEQDRFFQRLVHGTTLHGKQFLDPDQRREPLTYYHRTGPIGQVMESYNVPDGKGAYPNCAFIGLGTGTMACYAHKDQHVTFYDIDPVVKKISFDTDRYFTFIKDAKDRGANVDLILGDARLTMEANKLKPEDLYKIIVVDAFSSDAIPIHLITLNALQMYLTKITEDGLICFHVSNRYLSLEPVLANLAEAEKLDCLYFSDNDETDPGKARSTWVVLAKSKAALSKLLTAEKLEPLQNQWEKPLKQLSFLSIYGPGGPGELGMLLSATLKSLDAPWEEVPKDKKVGIWTDDYSNLWSVFNK